MHMLSNMCIFIICQKTFIFKGSQEISGTVWDQSPDLIISIWFKDGIFINNEIFTKVHLYTIAFNVYVISFTVMLFPYI